MSDADPPLIIKLEAEIQEFQERIEKLKKQRFRIIAIEDGTTVVLQKMKDDWIGL